MRLSYLFVGTCLVSSLAIGLWWLTSSDRNDGDGRVSEERLAPVEAWRTLEKGAKADPSPAVTRRRMLRNFPIMRGSPERMPLTTAARIRSTIGAPAGSLDLENAQRIQTAAGSSIWIVNGKGSITCLVQGHHGYFGCTTTADFAAHGLSIGMAEPSKKEGGPPRGFHVLGAAPDWVNVVKVRVGNGTPRNVAVRGGTYVTGPADVPIFVVGLCEGVGRGCRPA